ncbi:MAG: DUF4352 domain-containing protein, partial [Clostridia bacterium]|nr:DUF4352 domain-containing protein [Clostridia bacterium]MBR2734879.1 DUF4352 domain-containing protein [Clostridia bacterium]
MVSLHPKKSYKLNYIAIIPPIMAILSEIGVWMPILNVFSIFLGIMGIIFGTIYIIKVKKSTKKKISEFGLIALGNMIWIVAMVICAIMKFSPISYTDNTSSDFINQLTGFGYCGNKAETQSQQENGSIAEEPKTENKILKNYKINDTAELEGIKMTLTGIEKNFDMSSENLSPRQGTEFIKISVKIENTSNTELNVSESDIKIQDSIGAIENPISATSTLHDRFESAILAPGGIREGSV